MDDVIRDGPPIVMARIKEDLEKKTRNDQLLLAQEKKPEELIVPVWGRVTSVDSESIPMAYTANNGIIGPGYHSHTSRTGDTNRLEIGVSTNEVLKKIIFHGSSTIRAGDEVRAYVIKGKTEKLSMPIYPEHGHPADWKDKDIKTHILVEGELAPEMSALYLEILNETTLLRTDYSVHYDRENKKIVS